VERIGNAMDDLLGIYSHFSMSCVRTFLFLFLNYISLIKNDLFFIGGNERGMDGRGHCER
jgi:hypothetical protein